MRSGVGGRGARGRSGTGWEVERASGHHQPCVWAGGTDDLQASINIVFSHKPRDPIMVATLQVPL